jgi:CrcB protein
VSPITWVEFLAAAAIGAPARFLVDEFVQHATGRAFPWGTSVINVTGSLLLGFLSGLVLYHAVSPDVRLVLGTGFCGAYTTFSTFAFETVRLAETDRKRASIGNVALNTIGGLAAAATGLALAAAV